MDLDDGQRYAAAALFTLALHTTQVEVGVDETGNILQSFKAAWGCPDEELFDDLICVPENEPWPGMEVPNGFWGFDCCAPVGLCRRVYSALNIAETRWPGLLKMPDVSDAANSHDAQVALVGLVRRYCELLDPAVAPLIIKAVSLPALQQTESKLPEQQQPQQELEDSSSTQRNQQQQHLEKELKRGGEEPAKEAEEKEDKGAVTEVLREGGGGGGGHCLPPGGGSPQGAATAAIAVEGGDKERTGALKAEMDCGAGKDVGSREQPGKEEGTAKIAAHGKRCGPEEKDVRSGKRGQAASASSGGGAVNAACSHPPVGAGGGEEEEPSSVGASTVIVHIHTLSSPSSSPQLDSFSKGDEDGVGGSHPKGSPECGKASPWEEAAGEEAMRPLCDMAPGSTTGGTEGESCSISTETYHRTLRHDGEVESNHDDDDGAAAADNNSGGNQSRVDTSGPVLASAGCVARHHSPTHRSVLAMYELIGACLRAAAVMAEMTVEAAATGLIGSDGGGGGASGASTSGGGSADGGGNGGGFFRSSFWGIGGRGWRASGSSGDVSISGAAEVAAAPAVVRVVRKPLVRWYDARARVALRRLCHWLHIPAPKMHAMEAMWAMQLLQPRLAEGEAEGFDSSAAAAAAAAVALGAGAPTGTARYATYLKIGAGALGGAALLALTGGIAAPAIAAGLGSAIMVLHGSAAAATAVTSLGTTTAGTAAITGTFGVIGASHAASKTADLYGDLQEFGFWSISAPLVLPPPPCCSSEPPGAGDGVLDGSTTRHGGSSGAGEAAAAGTAAGAGAGSAPGGKRTGTGWEALFRWRPRAPLDEPLPQGVVKDVREVQSEQQQQQRSPKASKEAPHKLDKHTQLEQQPMLRVTMTKTAVEEVAAAPLMPSTPPPPPSLSAAAVMGLDPSLSPHSSPDPCMLRVSRTDPKLSQEGLFVPLQLLEASRELEESGGEVGRAGGGASCGGSVDPHWPNPADLFRSPDTSPFSRLTAPHVPEEEAAAAGVAEKEEQNLAKGGGAAAQAPQGLGLGLAEKGTLDSASGGGGVGMSGSRVLGVVGGDGADSGDGAASWASEDSDPWDVAEMEAAESRTAARARASIGGVDGAFLAALMAAYDAEAADLDGGSGAGGAASDVSASSNGGASGGGVSKLVVGDVSTSCEETTNTAIRNGKEAGAGSSSAAPTAAAAAGGRSSVWRWFRSSSKDGVGSGSGYGGPGGAGSGDGKGGLAADTGGRHQRPLLPVPIHPRRNGEATLALTIAVNGWVKQSDDFLLPWRPLPSAGRELWALVWESDVLRSLGGALRKFIRDKAIEESGKMVVRLGVSTALVTAMMLPMAVMSAINITIGSRWRVVLRRAQLAGRHLAHLLMQGAHGDRPVTLIGFSMGARLIFHCLLELSRCGARGLVECAVLLGTPVSANPTRWMAARSAVSGRLVNAFSSNDWVLGVIFRAHSRGALVSAAAGVCPVAVAGVENTNLSALIAGHTQYLEKLEEVLSALNLAEY